MQKIAIISNYFGSPPSYFQLWLDSCSANPSIDWKFFSDIPASAYQFPPNVHLIPCNFQGLKGRIRSCFNYPVRYNRPWDFCALRPSFGTLFKNELSGYAFWGYCDCDLVFGNLRSFFTEERLLCYDKFMPKGHLSLIRNNENLNHAIFHHPLMREALDISRPGLACFDEEAFVKEILPDLGAKQFNDIPFMNPKCRAGNFKLEQVYGVHQALNVKETDFLHNIYTWSNGQLIGHYAQRYGKWCASLPIAYCHFFRRPMQTNVKRLIGNHVLVIPNEFRICHETTFTASEIRWYNRFRIHWKYFQKRLTLSTLKHKLLEQTKCLTMPK